jgi:hypothetical protein
MKKKELKKIREKIAEATDSLAWHKYNDKNPMPENMINTIKLLNDVINTLDKELDGKYYVEQPL